MVEYLTELRKGALVCLDNADRLLEDAETLFAQRSYLSCFLLTQLASEELAKGFKLIEKYSKNKKFSKEEWEQLTSKPKAHVDKLKYLQEVEDKWMAEVTRGLGPELDYSRLLKKIAADIPWAGNVDKFRKKMSRAHYDWRIKSLYVDYDWTKKQWLEPLTQPIFNGIFIDGVICNADILKVKHLSSVLKSRLQNSM
jgi:AbiV family abortive infection protein